MLIFEQNIKMKSNRYEIGYKIDVQQIEAFTVDDVQKIKTQACTLTFCSLKTKINKERDKIHRHCAYKNKK